MEIHLYLIIIFYICYSYGVPTLTKLDLYNAGTHADIATFSQSGTNTISRSSYPSGFTLIPTVSSDTACVGYDVWGNGTIKGTSTPPYSIADGYNPWYINDGTFNVVVYTLYSCTNYNNIGTYHYTITISSSTTQSRTSSPITSSPITSSHISTSYLTTQSGTSLSLTSSHLTTNSITTYSPLTSSSNISSSITSSNIGITSSATSSVIHGTSGQLTTSLMTSGLISTTRHFSTTGSTTALFPGDVSGNDLEHASSHKNQVGLIVGVSIGGTIFLAAIITLVILLSRRKQFKRETVSKSSIEELFAWEGKQPDDFF